MKITKKDKVLIRNDEKKYNTNTVNNVLSPIIESTTIKSKKLSNGNNDYIAEDKSKDLLKILKSKQISIKLSKKGFDSNADKADKSKNPTSINLEKNIKNSFNKEKISNFESFRNSKKELNEKSIRETIKSRLSKNKNTVNSSLNSSINESFSKSSHKYSINGLQDNFNKRKLYKVPLDNKLIKKVDDNLYLKKQLTNRPDSTINKVSKITSQKNDNIYIKKNNLCVKKNNFNKNEYNTELQTSMDGINISIGYNGMSPLVHLNSKEKKERSNSFILYRSNNSHSKSSKPDTPSFEKDFSLDKSFSSNRYKDSDVYNEYSSNKNVVTKRKFTHRNREEIFSFGYCLK